MYRKFAELLQKRGVTTYQVAKSTGIGQSTFSDWKNGRSTPKADKLQKIADYFEVPIGYFTGEDAREKLPASQLLEDELIAFYGDVKADLTPDDIDDLMVAMRAKAERNKKKKSGES